MFSNIGSKIKTLAVILCIFGMIGSILGGISFMSACRGVADTCRYYHNGSRLSRVLDSSVPALRFR